MRTAKNPSARYQSAASYASKKHRMGVRLRLEQLEDRLPPGDASLGILLAPCLLGANIALPSQELAPVRTESRNLPERTFGEAVNQLCAATEQIGPTADFASYPAHPNEYQAGAGNFVIDVSASSGTTEAMSRSSEALRSPGLDLNDAFLDDLLGDMLLPFASHKVALTDGSGPAVGARRGAAVPSGPGTNGGDEKVEFALQDHGSAEGDQPAPRFVEGPTHGLIKPLDLTGVAVAQADSHAGSEQAGSSGGCSGGSGGCCSGGTDANPTVSLKSVRYLGAGAFSLRKQNDNWTNDKFGDPGDTLINYPEWQADPAVNEPTGYVRASTPSMTAVLKLSQNVDNPLAAKVHVKGTGGLAQGVDFTKDVSLSGTEVTVTDLSWNVAVPNKVRNDLAPLSWEISICNGGYQSIGSTNTPFFVTYDTPAGYYANGNVTAKRVDRVTRLADGKDDIVDIAKTIRDSLNSNPGFDLHTYFDDQTANHWSALDPPVDKLDCISLAVLAAKHLRMLGITATEGRAYPTGGLGADDTDAGGSEFKTVDGKAGILGFESGGFNRFEGFFEVSDGGTRKAFTVAPALGPIVETTLPVRGDKLKYNVIKTTLENLSAKQYWYEKLNDSGSHVGNKINDTEVPFPVPSP